MSRLTVFVVLISISIVYCTPLTTDKQSPFKFYHSLNANSTHEFKGVKNAAESFGNFSSYIQKKEFNFGRLGTSKSQIRVKYSSSKIWLLQEVQSISSRSIFNCLNLL